MDFVSETFPNTRVHIALYQLNPISKQPSNDNVVEFPNKVDERKKQLLSLVKTYENNFTVVNVSNIISLVHLNLAIARALIARRD